MKRKIPAWNFIEQIQQHFVCFYVYVNVVYSMCDDKRERLFSMCVCLCCNCQVVWNAYFVRLLQLWHNLHLSLANQFMTKCIKLHLLIFPCWEEKQRSRYIKILHYYFTLLSRCYIKWEIVYAMYPIENSISQSDWLLFHLKRLFITMEVYLSTFPVV